jgi:hypothetical protein
VNYPLHFKSATKLADDIKRELKKDLNNVFAIGKILSEQRIAMVDGLVFGSSNKEESDSNKQTLKTRKAMWRDAFKHLPFGEAVGMKFIRIYQTDYLRALAEHNQYSKNLPWGYNNLYGLCHSDIVMDDEKVALFTNIFKEGEYEIDWKAKPSVRMTLGDIQKLCGRTQLTGQTDCNNVKSRFKALNFFQDDIQNIIEEKLTNTQRLKFEGELSNLLRRYGIAKHNFEIVKEAA